MIDDDDDIASPIRLVIQFDLAGADLESFDAYEDEVLELLEDHGGKLYLRLRAVDRPIETHIVTFPSRGSMEAYMANPKRERLQPLFQSTGVKMDSWEAVEPG